MKWYTEERQREFTVNLINLNFPRSGEKTNKLCNNFWIFT